MCLSQVWEEGKKFSFIYEVDVCLSFTRPDVCQAAVTNTNVRGGRMKRKMHSFEQQTSLDGNL